MKKYTYLVNFDSQTLERVGESFAVKGDGGIAELEFAIPSNFGIPANQALWRVFYRLPGEKESLFETLPAVTATESGDYVTSWTISKAITQKAGRLAFSLTAISGENVQWNSRTVIMQVPESQYQPESEEAEEPYTGRLTTLEGDMAQIRGELGDVVDEFEELRETATLGAPIPKSLASEMVEGGIYLYTGAEPGYTVGHVYYYVNGTLTDGGVYGGTAVDATLTQSGQAADAKKTGDEISQIKEDLITLSDLNSTLVIRSLYAADRSGGGVDFTYVPEDGSFNVTTETVVTNKNNAWKNLLNGTDSLFGMIPGEKYFCEIEKTGEGAETVFIWYQCYQNGVLFGNPRRIYNSNFFVIDEGATGILVRLTVSTNNVALNCNIKIRLERYMSNRALQNNVNNISDTISQMQPDLNILTLGDSIAYGGRNGLKGFVGDLGMPYVNIAVTGATISTVRATHKNIFTQLLDYHTENPSYSPDCIVADGGINDYISSAPMGDIPTVPARNDTDAEALDRSTLMGATGYLFYQMIKLYPRAQRFFVIIHKIYRTEYNVYYPTNSRPGITYTQEDMHDALVKICGVYGVKVIDVYKDSMLNTAFSQYVSPTPFSSDPSVTDLYFTDTDGVHPLALGYKEAYIPLVKLALMGATKK